MRSLRFVATAGLVLSLAGCAESPGPGLLEPDPHGDVTAAEGRVASQSTAFGLALLRELHAADGTSNVLISPLSVSMSLGMALNGARGETFDAMRRALGFDGMTEDEINEAYRGLVSRLRDRDPAVEFALANAAWIEQSFDVDDAFLERVRRYFDAEIGPIDVLDPGSPAVINAWVESKTGGRIRDLIQHIDPLDRLFLVNAVYFKAPWTLPFEPNATRPEPFLREDRIQVQVEMMMQDGQFRWFRDDEAQGVELLYADSAFSMVVVAPVPGRSLDDLAAGLTAARWEAWMDRFETSRLMLSLPKFRFDYGVQLQVPLANLGMGIAFRPFEADFQRIAPVEDLHISRVKHKTFIDVHELGTEAAAATVTVISVTSMPPRMAFDRPFLFAIRERSTGTLIFAGRVGDPTAD